MGDEASTPAADLPPLQSVFTQSIPQLLAALKSSLLVTTYQAGRLVILRAEQGGTSLNSHFRAFTKPMGLAAERGRIALGTAAELWEFHNVPGVPAKLKGESHDAAFLPRCVHFTGDIQVHEMAWVPAPASAPGPSTLWFINTRFSCLATRSGIYSFVPRWKPHFISAIAPEDRCHLNGIGLRDGVVRYATALGRTDNAGGWRANKRSGGILMDVPANEIIADGFSMPHSPRWHDGRLWILDSGNGGIGVVDPVRGHYQEVCRLPGCTRGLDFYGPYAFVGLSQVRESAVFSGIAVAELKPEERCCGMWVVDTRSGQVAGYVKFTSAVQEVFAVQLLHGLHWPDVVTQEAAIIAESFELPDETLRQVPPELRRR